MKLREFFEQEAREEQLEERLYSIFTDDELQFLGDFQLDYTRKYLEFLLEPEYDFMKFGWLIPTIENMQSYINRLLDAEIKNIEVEQSYNNKSLYFTISLENVTREILLEHSTAIVTSISCDYKLKERKVQTVKSIDTRQFKNIIYNDKLEE